MPMPSVMPNTNFLPDNVWILRTEKLSHLKEKNVIFSISDINDSDVYSTVGEINTAGLFSDQHISNINIPRDAAKKLKKIHFQDETDHQPKTKSSKFVHPKPLSARTKHDVDVKTIRSAINSLGKDDQEVRVYVHNQGEFDEGQDSLSTDLNSFMRMASEGTKKVFKKIKSAELSPKNLWKRNHPDVAEAGSSESLSSAGPATLYHLPQEMSPVTDTSPGASTSTSDMDTSHREARAETEREGNDWWQIERHDGQGLLRRKASGALKYVRKWKVASKVGGWLPRNRTRNGSTDMDVGESAWNSQTGGRALSRDESVRRRFARTLSF